MIRQPPISTLTDALFPYTTLVRSGEVGARDSRRLPAITSYRMPGVASSVQLIQFDMEGISVFAGSPCSSGTLKASPVLTAMGWAAKAAGEVVRVSFGPFTTHADVERFLCNWNSIYARARRCWAGAIIR